MNSSIQRKGGALLSYLSIIINTIVQLLYTPFLIRILGQGEYGLYSLISSIIGYLTVLDLGFGNAIVVFSIKYRAHNNFNEEEKLLGMFKIIFYIIGILAALLGLILYFNVENLFSNTMTTQELEKAKIMMLILSVNLAFTFSFSIYQSVITAHEKFIFQKVLSILNTILKPLIMIPLLFLGFKSITMTIVITFVNIFVLLSNYTYCSKRLKIKIKFKGFDKKIFNLIFGYSIFIFVGVIVDKVNWSIDQFILGAVSGTIAVSIYSVASQLNSLFINLSNAVSGVLLPKISNMIANKVSSDELTNEMIKVGRIQYYIIFFMASGIVLFGKEFILWWAGAGFEESYYVALLLIIPISFPLIQNLGISIMQAMNKYKFKAVSTFIMAVLNVLVSYFLAKKYGAIGCAIGTAASLILCNIILINIYYYKVLKLDIIKFWKNIFKMTLTFIIPIGVILMVMLATNLTGILSVIIYGIIYTIIYTFVSYLFTMDYYEKSIINNILKKMKITR